LTRLQTKHLKRSDKRSKPNLRKAKRNVMRRMRLGRKIWKLRLSMLSSGL